MDVGPYTVSSQWLNMDLMHGLNAYEASAFILNVPIVVPISPNLNTT